MGTLLVANGYRVDLPGLGKIGALLSLSEKRVSKAVRKELRDRYGFDAVEVACNPIRYSDEWRGTCKISGELFAYKIFSK